MAISPDSGVPNADWTQFDPPKKVTHFLHQGQGEHEIHDLVYYRQFLADMEPREDVKLYSFRLGYFFHLISDIMWAKRVWQATQLQFKPLFDIDPREAVNLAKGDWYGLDQLYVRDHPEHIFWRVIATHPFPPSYLPFIRNEALHHQYDHIRRFYSVPDDPWFLSIPYQYLNENTMTRIVNDSVEAILIVYQKVKETTSFDGWESSVSLLPESLLTPYQEPLGN